VSLALKLKRAYAISLAAVVWTAKDLWEVLCDSFIPSLITMAASAVMLTPIGWVIGLAMNGRAAYRYRQMITKETGWSWKKRS